MAYTTELPREGSEITTSKFKECRTRYAFKVEGKNWGREEKNAVTTERPDSWRLKDVQNNITIYVIRVFAKTCHKFEIKYRMVGWKLVNF